MIAFKTLFLFSAAVRECVCAHTAGRCSDGSQGGEDRGGVHKIFKMFPTLLSRVSGQAMAVAVGV